MLISFDDMPDHARIWIYQVARKLTEQEAAFVSQNTRQFLNQWQAHGQDLQASFEIKYDQFLIISVDESFSQASGCSIDASVHLIRALEHELNTSFMTTDQVAFKTGSEINLLPFSQVKKEVANRAILPETLIFDNTAKNVGDFKKKWLVESKDSWIARYF